jgi:hypothetical protein
VSSILMSLFSISGFVAVVWKALTLYVVWLESD